MLRVSQLSLLPELSPKLLRKDGSNEVEVATDTIGFRHESHGVRSDTVLRIIVCFHVSLICISRSIFRLTEVIVLQLTVSLCQMQDKQNSTDQAESFPHRSFNASIGSSTTCFSKGTRRRVETSRNFILDHLDCDQSVDSWQIAIRICEFNSSTPHLSVLHRRLSSVI